jgi:hypothetical protein
MLLTDTELYLFHVSHYMFQHIPCNSYIWFLNICPALVVNYAYVVSLSTTEHTA